MGYIMKKKLKILLCILIASIGIFGLVILSQEKMTPSLGTETVEPQKNHSLHEAFANLKTISFSMELDIPSYVELCELDYVPTPHKYTPDEAVQKIESMLETYPEVSVVIENADIYPDEVLKSLAGNPEMVNYAVNYLDKAGNIYGGFTEDEKPEDYPLFLQWDIRWGYMAYGSQGTVGSSGCGPACLAMAVYYLTGSPDCTPDAIAQYSLDTRYYIEGTGTAWALLDEYPTQFGLTVTHPSLSEANLKAELDKGNILICSCRPGDFTSEGHFIVIYGYDENGFKINDPKCVYRSRLSWTYDQIQDDIKRTWSIGQ